jgi:CRISPR/Cas system-associated endonuclease Cas3-HD
MNQEIREQEEIMEKPYTLRRLRDRDLFPILNIISEVFPDELSAVFVQLSTKEKSVQEVGAMAILKLVLAVLKNMDKVQDDVYALLSDVSGIPADELKEMEFGTTPMMIWDIVANEKNCGFFKVLSKLS